MTRYVNSTAGLQARQLQGFFVGWPNPPSPQIHLEILRGSDYVVVAVDDESDTVVGFVTAISDGVLSVYIPLLEVLPSYQKQGIGRELMKRLLERVGRFYMIDLLCDPEAQPFYARLGMTEATAMMIRNFDRQSGEKEK